MVDSRMIEVLEELDFENVVHKDDDDDGATEFIFFDAVSEGNRVEVKVVKEIGEDLIDVYERQSGYEDWSFVASEDL